MVCIGARESSFRIESIIHTGANQTCPACGSPPSRGRRGSVDLSAVAGRGPAPELLGQAAVEGYTTAFWWEAGIFAIGALVCGSLLRPGARPELAHEAEPAAARP
jgi:hypothetical protein